MSDLTYREIDGRLLSLALTAAFGAELDTQDVPVELVELLAEHLDEGLDGCDHSVGICECSERATKHELDLWLARKQTCPDCGGEGFGDEMVTEHVVDPDTGDDYDVQMGCMCLTCCGRGVVDMNDGSGAP